MLQRPQTLYMLAAVIFLTAALAFPIMKAATLTETYRLFTYGCQYCNAPETACTTYEPHPFAETWGVAAGALHILSLGLMGLAIGSFKKRMTQIRLTAMVNLAVLGALGIMLYAYNKLSAPEAGLFDGLQFGFFLLLAAPIANLVAISKIRKDDNLVRSMNRLR